MRSRWNLPIYLIYLAFSVLVIGYIIAQVGIPLPGSHRYEVTAQWAGFADKPTYHDAQAVGHKLAELYEAEDVDRVVLLYNRYESALVQRVTTTDLLPIREEVLGAEEEAAAEKEERGGVSADRPGGERPPPQAVGTQALVDPALAVLEPMSRADRATVRRERTRLLLRSPTFMI